MNIGKINKMIVDSVEEKGIYVRNEENERLFVAERNVKGSPMEGDEVSVFIYTDAKSEPVATLFIPYAVDGEFDFMTVKKVMPAGALLDWGIERDLFLPSREQTAKLREGKSYLVHVHYDENTNQIVASMHLDDYMSTEFPPYKMNDEVDLLVTKETDLGYAVIVDDKYWGLIYHSEIFEKVDFAMRTIGYVKNVREDGKIDVALQKQGYEVVEELSEQIVEALQREGGFLPFNDKTESDLIYNKFGCSKKSFKKTIGTLYRERVIMIEENGIRLQRSNKKR